MKVIESMTLILDIPQIRIRVWREEHELRRDYDNSDLGIEAWSVANSNPQQGLVPALAEALVKLPRVNAVEVLSGGNGIVCYSSWP